jgi:hypothetical protein
MTKARALLDAFEHNLTLVRHPRRRATQGLGAGESLGMQTEPSLATGGPAKSFFLSSSHNVFDRLGQSVSEWYATHDDVSETR